MIKPGTNIQIKSVGISADQNEVRIWYASQVIVIPNDHKVLYDLQTICILLDSLRVRGEV